MDDVSGRSDDLPERVGSSWDRPSGTDPWASRHTADAAGGERDPVAAHRSGAEAPDDEAPEDQPTGQFAGRVAEQFAPRVQTLDEPATVALVPDEAATADLTPEEGSEHDIPEQEAPVEQPRPVPPDLDAEKLAQRYARQRRGPLQRLSLWASGVDTVVLEQAPIDSREYSVQGNLVLLTASVAAVAGAAATSFLVYGRFVASALTIIVGLAWGAGILFLDRALVSGSLNPHRFSRRDIATLTRLFPGTPWEHVLPEGPVSPVASRVRQLTWVTVLGSFRVALAIATSFIVAEMAMFLVFAPEVNARTSYLEGQERTQRVDEITAFYQQRSADRQTQREQLTGSNDPDILRLTTELADLTTRLDNARHDLGIYHAAAAAEQNGIAYQGTLSDGEAVSTTGRPGNGPATRSLSTLRDLQQQIVDDLAARQARTQADLDARRSLVSKNNQVALDTLTRQDNEDAQAEREAIAAVTNENPLQGLLRRQAALTMLTYDTNPETLEPDPIPACRGATKPFCVVRNWLMPPTPMGPTVVAFRTIFLLVELLPILFKIMQSLRPRRPYDVAKAALEHVSALRMHQVLDRALHEANADMVSRGQRVGPLPEIPVSPAIVRTPRASSRPPR
ncbi:MAG TPA: DUF4407 domain-containing protein [Micromonosporaceae bacterium]|jgi:hypothetical protein